MGEQERGFRRADTLLVAYEKRSARWQRPMNPHTILLVTIGEIKGR